MGIAALRGRVGKGAGVRSRSARGLAADLDLAAGLVLDARGLAADLDFEAGLALGLPTNGNWTVRRNTVGEVFAAHSAAVPRIGRSDVLQDLGTIREGRLQSRLDDAHHRNVQLSRALGQLVHLVFVYGDGGIIERRTRRRRQVQRPLQVLEATTGALNIFERERMKPFRGSRGGGRSRYMRFRWHMYQTYIDDESIRSGTVLPVRISSVLMEK